MPVVIERSNNVQQRTEELPLKSRHFQLKLGGVEWASQVSTVKREWFPMTRMCALYRVTRAGYYAWRRRGESARRRQDHSILTQIRAIFDQSRGTYGSPRVQRALGAAGVRMSRRRIAHLMREAGLRARVVKLYRRIPGSHGFFLRIPDRQLDRLATGPDQVWIGDITYLRRERSPHCEGGSL